MALTTAQIQNAYVAFFNRPADVAGLTYWSSYAGSTADLLNTFAQSAEYKALYNGLNNTQVVNAVYNNLFGHTPDVAGLTYWVTQLDQGKLAIGNIADAINKGAQGTDATIISNKTTAATSFTTALDTTAKIVAYAGVNSTGLSAVKAWLAAVTSDATTLTNATSTTTLTSITTTVLNNVGTTGNTYTLTTGVDTLGGTAGNDTYIADNSVNQNSAADSIAAGDGNDTLKIYAKSGTGVVLPSLSSVENVWVSGTDTALDLSSTTGVTSLTLDSQLDAAGVTYTLAGQALTLSNWTLPGTGGARTYAVASATDTVENITLSKVQPAANSVTLNVTGTKVTTVNLTSSGTLAANTANTVTLDNQTGVKVDTVTVAGSSALNLTVGGNAAAAFASTGIKSIDASAATGNVSVKVTGGGSAGQTDLASTFSIKGGSGNDTLDLSAATVGGTAVSAAQLKAMTIDGGAGTDTLIVKNAIGTGTTALTNLTNIENIGVLDANGTVNIANFNGVTGLALTGTLGGAVIVNNLGSTGTLNLGTAVQGGNALTVNATGTGTTDTLAMTYGSATAAFGAKGAATTINGYETVNLTVQGADTTTLTGGVTFAASAGGSETVNLVLSKALTENGNITLSGSSTTLNISGAGNFASSGVITAGSVNVTSTGTINASGANKVLSFDASANNAAITFNDSAATSAAILKGGNGGVTFTGSGFNDIISVGSGTNNVTGGAGADLITINHGSATNVTTLTIATPASDSGDATGFAASTAVPTAAFSTTAMDIVTGFKAGDKVQLTGLTTGTTLLNNASTTGAATAGDVILVKGTYSASANTFTASTSGTDSALVYDSNGTTAGGTYQTIVLVGYVDSGSADTISNAGLFTAVA